MFASHFSHDDSFRTQGSTKVFKSVNNKACVQSICVSLGSGSLLAFIPEPTTCFTQSKYKQTQSFVLHADASLIAVDWFSSGRMVAILKLQCSLDVYSVLYCHKGPG